jgi:hypothetical protein
MSKLPSKVRIDHTDWTIKAAAQRDIDIEMLNQGPPGAYGGYMNPRDLVIAVKADEKRPASMQARTLLHEILHGCLVTYGELKGQDEEKLVVHLESQLTGVIKNNPKVINYLKENL